MYRLRGLHDHDIEHTPIALPDEDEFVIDDCQAGEDDARARQPGARRWHTGNTPTVQTHSTRPYAHHHATAATAIDDEFDEPVLAAEAFDPADDAFDADTGYSAEPLYAYPEEEAPPEADLGDSAEPYYPQPPLRRLSPARQRSAAWRMTTALLCLALAGLTAWGIVVLRDPNTLPLKAVHIEGSFQHVTTAALQQAIAGVASGGFLRVDVDAIRAAARRVPWVHDVNVRRVWPDTLRVSVSEQTPMARWTTSAGPQPANTLTTSADVTLTKDAVAGSTQLTAAPAPSIDGLLNNDGELFSPDPASYPAGLPELHGPAGTQAMALAEYQAMNKAVALLGLHITRLELDERRAWRVSLDNGIELMLGRLDAYARLLRFAQIYQGALAAQATNIARVDLRYSNGLAVRFKNGQ